MYSRFYNHLGSIFSSVYLSMDYFLKKYCYTINHKRLGLNYFYFSMISGLSGAVLATIIRIELSFPGSPFLAGDSLRYLQVITSHALVMIFFVVVPLFFGGFANFLIPYQIGSRDVAFPRLNSLGFWMQPCGFLLVAKVGFMRRQYFSYYDYIGFYEKYKTTHERALMFRKFDKVVDKDEKTVFTYFNDFLSIYFDYFQIYLVSDSIWVAIKDLYRRKWKKRVATKCSSVNSTTGGWTFITPFSSNIRFTAIGTEDLLIIGILYAGLSSTISIVNLLVTRRVLSIFGIKNRKILLPFISISLFLMLRALALINPVLGAAMIMLILDRHWHTAFFDFTYGGDAILFQHLFWFFGHPEVYVLIVPAFGIINEILPEIGVRRIAAKYHMMWAIYVMTYMGFLVWGHHMYLIGLDHRSRSLYSTITILISLPATIKVVNWILTLLNTQILDSIPLIFSAMFISFFLVAGITGMWLSHVSLNIAMHDTFYVVAHFHIMLSGASITAIFAGIYYYFYVFFGITYNKILAMGHAFYYFIGQWITFLPMFWIGFSGMPRRVHDYQLVFLGWQNIATIGHVFSLIGIICFYAMMFEAHYYNKVAYGVNYNISRVNMRVIYYIYKVLKIVLVTQKLTYLPNYKAYRQIVCENLIR